MMHPPYRGRASEATVLLEDGRGLVTGGCAPEAPAPNELQLGSLAPGPEGLLLSQVLGQRTCGPTLHWSSKGLG